MHTTVTTHIGDNKTKQTINDRNINFIYNLIITDIP